MIDVDGRESWFGCFRRRWLLRRVPRRRSAALHTGRVLLVVPNLCMDAQQMRRAMNAAYAKPEVKPIRRTPSPVPGWWFDMTVILLFVVFAALYFAA
jgi:hypothetical protein